MNDTNKFPTVATIIGCPEQLSATNGLVATPLAIPGDFQTSGTMGEESSAQVKDPVQQAVIDNICGTVPKSFGKNADIIRCEVCNIECNGMQSFIVHTAGAKHAKKVKEAEIKEFADLPFIVEDKGSHTFTCTYCNATLNALSQIEAHIEGSKHKSKAKNIQEISDKNSKINTDPSKPRIDATPNLLYCATCNIHVNSTLQLAQHTTSMKHINKVNGKNRNRFTPYTKHIPENVQSGGGPIRKKMPVERSSFNGKKTYGVNASFDPEDYQKRWVKGGGTYHIPRRQDQQYDQQPAAPTAYDRSYRNDAFEGNYQERTYNAPPYGNESYYPAHPDDRSYSDAGEIPWRGDADSMYRRRVPASDNYSKIGRADSLRW